MLKTPLRHFLTRPNYYKMLLFDSLLIVAARAGAYLIRFEGQIHPENLPNLWKLIPFVLLVKLVVFHFFKLYRGMWRFTGLLDLWNIIKASTTASLIIAASLFLFFRFQGFSRSVLVLDYILTTGLIALLRVGIRYYLTIYKEDHLVHGQAEQPVKNLLIIGAGAAGEQVHREITNRSRGAIKVVGFLDDSPGKWGCLLHGTPVLGGVDSLPKAAEEYQVDQIVIAVPSASGEQMRRLIRACKESGLPFKTLPSVRQIIDGKVSLKAIREVSFEDLLRRPEVHLDIDDVAGILSGKRVLITGAGGSIGSELCRQIARFQPSEMILLDCVEKNLFDLENELREDFGRLNLSPILGSILDRPRMRRLFEDKRPELVFHAAAYKHVHLVELNPWEGILNNVAGTRNILDLALQSESEYFVLVSSDKAVRPTSIMGATKRVGEMMMSTASNEKTRCLAVRFGNVVGSSGSVVPVFLKQIAAGGPVTVTDPEVTRYFMTVSEAAQLILQAASMGRGGEIFILEMGRPVKIVDLVQDLMILSGVDPKAIKIEYIGLRPGEKLFEELITDGEGIVPTDHERIMVLRGDGFDRENLDRKIDELLRLRKNFDSEAIKQTLRDIIPEYKPFS